MPFEILDGPDHPLVFARAFGQGNVDEGHKMISALLTHAERRPGVPVLIDLKDLLFSPRKSAAEVFALRLAGGLSNRRVAFVAAAGAAFFVARVIEQLSPARDVESATFIDRELALHWLRGEIDVSAGSDWL